MEICMKIFLFLIQLLIVYGKVSPVVPTDLSALKRNITKDLAALRYGFHKTWECHEFNKAFLCIQKCLDLNYDIAYSDKKCSCTCYFNKYKAKYTIARNFTLSKWKSGAPTTSLPAWAMKNIPSKGINSLELSDHDDSHENKNGPKQDNSSKNDTSTDNMPTKSSNASNVTQSGALLENNQPQPTSPKLEGGLDDAGKAVNLNAEEPANGETGQTEKDQAGDPANEKPTNEQAGQPANENAGEPTQANTGGPATEQAGQSANEQVSEAAVENTDAPKAKTEAAAEPTA